MYHCTLSGQITHRHAQRDPPSWTVSISPAANDKRQSGVWGNSYGSVTMSVRWTCKHRTDPLQLV